MHLSAEGQEAPQTYPAPDGTLALCQVVPLLVVKMMAAAGVVVLSPESDAGTGGRARDPRQLRD